MKTKLTIVTVKQSLKQLDEHYGEPKELTPEGKRKQDLAMRLMVLDHEEWKKLGTNQPSKSTVDQLYINR